MKILLSTALLFFAFSFTTLAQSKYPKHSLKIGFGNSNFHTTDFQGKTRYLEYNRQLFKRFSIGLDANWAQATNFKEDNLEKGLNQLTGNAHFFFAPIQKQNAALKIGFGPSFYTSKYDFTSLNTDIKPTVPESYTTQGHGFSIAVDFEIFVIKKWSLGTRGNYQQYKNGDRVYFWGFNTGFRF